MSSDMNSNAQRELLFFVSRFLESKGAAVEKKNEAWDALVSEDMAKELGVPDHFRFDVMSSGKDIFSVNFGSSLLDRIIESACARPPLISCALEFDYIKTQGFDKLVSEQFRFNGAVHSVDKWATVNTEYLLATSKYIAQSDEQKEGLITIAINRETGSCVPGMPELINHVTKKYGKIFSSSFDQKQTEMILAMIEKNIAEKLSADMEPFRESMNRRLRRDIINIEEYYDSLKKEMEESMTRPGLSSQNIEERRAKIELIPDELASKKDDLFKKYSIKTEIKPAAIMQIKTSAVKVFLKIMVGRKRLDQTVIYNPVTKCLDPLVCRSCGKSTTSLFFCDNLHVLCSLCRNSCGVCGKA